MSNGEETFSRFEFKYVLDPLQYMEVRDFVESIGLAHDANSPVNPYMVTSLYYDSVGLDDYYDKAGGFLDRKKVRIRAYGDTLDGSRMLHFEIKNKHDMYIAKDRVAVSSERWHDIVQGNFSGLFNEFHYHILNEGRAPSAIVRYEREAFDYWFYDRIRLTFDRNIEAMRPEAFGDADENSLWYSAVSVSGPRTILEIKFEKKLPWWFLMMMDKFSLRRTAYSKYANAVDALYRYNPLPR